MINDVDRHRVLMAMREGLRLAYNRQGAYHKEHPELQWQWYNYAFRPQRLGGSKYKNTLMPIVHELVTVRDRIRRARISDAEWRSMDLEDKAAQYKWLYGDTREGLKNSKLPADLAAPDFQRFLATRLDLMSADDPPSGSREELNAAPWAEDDTGEYLTVNQYNIVASAMPGNVVSWVRRAGSGVLAAGNFEHYLTAYAEYDSQALARLIFWAATDEDIDGYADASADGLFFFVYTLSGPGNHYLYLYDYAGEGLENESMGTSDFTRYCILSRTGTDSDCALYTDATWETLDDNLDVAWDANDRDYQYAMLGNHHGSITAWYNATMSDLYLQEAAAPVVRSRGFIIG